MFDSLWPHELYNPWDSPGQNTGVGSLSLLQGISATQDSNPGLLHCRHILYHLNHKGSPRILERVAYPFSGRSSWPRNQTGVSCIAGGFFTNWAVSSVWDECNCVVVWAFFGIAYLWDWNGLSGWPLFISSGCYWCCFHVLLPWWGSLCICLMHMCGSLCGMRSCVWALLDERMWACDIYTCSLDALWKKSYWFY